MSGMQEKQEHTPGPWDWVIHDHSMASLGVLPDPGLGDPLVLAISPCRACAKRAGEAGKEWEWGRCHTPSLADARLLSAAPELYAVAQSALDAINAMDRLHTLRRGGYSRKAEEEAQQSIIDTFLDQRRAALSKAVQP
jgi:hypothetical protein